MRRSRAWWFPCGLAGGLLLAIVACDGGRISRSSDDSAFLGTWAGTVANEIDRGPASGTLELRFEESDRGRLTGSCRLEFGPYSIEAGRLSGSDDRKNRAAYRCAAGSCRVNGFLHRHDARTLSGSILGGADCRDADGAMAGRLDLQAR